MCTIVLCPAVGSALDIGAKAIAAQAAAAATSALFFIILIPFGYAVEGLGNCSGIV
jgi:hypothetical protein